MGYQLEGVLTRPETLNCLLHNPNTTPKILAAFREATVVRLEQDVCLIPVTMEWYDAHFMDETVSFDGMDTLSRPLGDDLLELSLYGTVGYVEADYFGGTGEQWGIVWRGGDIVYGPVKASIGTINAVLRRLDVQQRNAVDEFAAVGLGRFRHTQEWGEFGKSER